MKTALAPTLEARTGPTQASGSMRPLSRLEQIDSELWQLSKRWRQLALDVEKEAAAVTLKYSETPTEKLECSTSIQGA